MTAPGMDDSRLKQWASLLKDVSAGVREMAGELGGSGNVVSEQRMSLTSLHRNITRALADIAHLEQK